MGDVTFNACIITGNHAAVAFPGVMLGGHGVMRATFDSCIISANRAYFTAVASTSLALIRMNVSTARHPCGLRQLPNLRQRRGWRKRLHSWRTRDHLHICDGAERRTRLRMSMPGTTAICTTLATLAARASPTTTIASAIATATSATATATTYATEHATSRRHGTDLGNARPHTVLLSTTECIGRLARMPLSPQSCRAVPA